MWCINAPETSDSRRPRGHKFIIAKNTFECSERDFYDGSSVYDV